MSFPIKKGDFPVRYVIVYQSHIALFGNPTKSCHQGGTNGLEPPSAASKPMRQGRRLTMEAPGFAKALRGMEVYP